MYSQATLSLMWLSGKRRLMFPFLLFLVSLKVLAGIPLSEK
jgi:hypothetical protein